MAELFFKHIRSPRGFSLIELVIVVGVIVVVSSVILIRFPALGAQVRFTNSVQTILDAIRDARARSAAITEFAPGSGIFPSYGVFFELANPGQIRFYADCKIDDNGDGILDDKDFFSFNSASTDCSSTNGSLAIINLDRGITITGIRSFEALAGPYKDETRGSIEYLRPEPSVWIADSSGIVLGHGGLELQISDGQQVKKMIMWTSGNIEVQ